MIWFLVNICVGRFIESLGKIWQIRLSWLLDHFTSHDHPYIFWFLWYRLPFRNRWSSWLKNAGCVSKCWSLKMNSALFRFGNKKLWFGKWPSNSLLKHQAHLWDEDLTVWSISWSPCLWNNQKTYYMGNSLNYSLGHNLNYDDSY